MCSWMGWHRGFGERQSLFVGKCQAIERAIQEAPWAVMLTVKILAGRKPELSRDSGREGKTGTARYDQR